MSTDLISTKLPRNYMAVFAVAVAAVAHGSDTVRYPSIAAIHVRPQPPGAIATVQATLTLNGNPSYVQDSTGGAEVDGLSTQGLKIGDEVLVTGEPADTENGRWNSTAVRWSFYGTDLRYLRFR